MVSGPASSPAQPPGPEEAGARDEPSGADGYASRRLARRAAFASLVGTAVEWYDYFIFGTASTLVFGRLFFPGDDPLIGTLSAFAVFGVGFFARPIGGIVFGHLGDRIGRKAALVTTLLMMGTATFLIGLLPTAAAIGVWAPVLLVVCRLVQGLGVGGEWGGASLVAVEFAPEGKRGLYGTFPQIGNAVGLVLSTGIFAWVSTLDQQQLFSWGWRVPFLLSGVLIALGMVIRLKLTETPSFRAAQRSVEQDSAEADKLPLRQVLRRFRKPLLLAMGMRLGEVFAGYLILTIGLAYAKSYTDLPETDVLLAGTLAAVLALFGYGASGIASDRYGRRALFAVGAVAGAVLVFPFFWALDTNSVVLMYVVYVGFYVLSVGPMYGVEPAFFAELFGTKVRYTGISLAAQLPGILIGLWPAASTALLIATGGDPWPVAAITGGFILIGLVCAWLAPETSKTGLDDADTTVESAAAPRG
ncbi:MHS family MFS transporter [Saccharopolyspora sp. HNM0986]|uniref:MFS transporter n=1 Tax=Saccharopolyspora galaxeae TaxID=2781241 RepID=UPI00190CB451|nr:MFS transporter [Saccharopolyspora sp. HNM0986]MBK0868925.1 MHS family MFS transporter [Saccharopolyspora sp. HNM0986]